jgi:DNA polymerase V
VGGDRADKDVGQACQLRREAVCEFAARAAKKLRQERRTARIVDVFICTCPYQTRELYYASSAAGKLPLPSNDTRDIFSLATRFLDLIWRGGHRYAKAGFLLEDFFDSKIFQPGLLDADMLQPHREALMNVVDTIHQEGRGRV